MFWPGKASQLVAFSALISGEFAPLFYGLRKQGIRESNKSSVRREISSCCGQEMRYFSPNPHSDGSKCENKCIFKNQFSPGKVRPCELCDEMIKIALRGASERVCFWVVLCGQHISQGTRAWRRHRDKDSVIQAARCCCRLFVYLPAAEFGHSASTANKTRARTWPKWNVGACANSETDSFEGAHKGIAITFACCILANLLLNSLKIAVCATIIPQLPTRTTSSWLCQISFGMREESCSKQKKP